MCVIVMFLYELVQTQCYTKALKDYLSGIFLNFDNLCHFSLLACIYHVISFIGMGIPLLWKGLVIL